MEIVAALFTENIDLRPVPGPSTRIDLEGVQFSAPAPGPVPVTVAPHLVVLVWCPPDEEGFGALEVVFNRLANTADGSGAETSEPMARNVQALQIEPGKFNYRLVRADLAFTDYETVVASASIDGGPAHRVPYTLLPPVE